MKMTDFNIILLQEISGHKKRFFLLCVLIILLLISWTGILDKVPYKYLDDSFTNATVSYVASRSINAAVSVMQTTEVGFLGFTSVQVGQMLDPINDMAERFSDLIVIAIASIITQKIFLTIISSIAFNTLLTFSALILIVSIYLKKTIFIEGLVRIFIFLLFLRLALSLMVLLNYSVDEVFLNKDIKYNQTQIQGLSYELDIISEISENKKGEVDVDDINDALKSDINNFLQQKEKLNSEFKSQSNELLKLQENVNDIENSIDQAKGSLSFIDRYNPIHRDEDLKTLKQSLSVAESILNEKKDYVGEINKNIEEIDNKIVYKRNVIVGEPNDDDGFFSSFTSDVIGFFKKMDPSEVIEMIDSKIVSLVNLLALYVMKTLILPILFMYLLLKVFKLIWAIDLAELIKREVMTLNPTDPPVTTEAK